MVSRYIEHVKNRKKTRFDIYKFS